MATQPVTRTVGRWTFVADIPFTGSGEDIGFDSDAVIEMEHAMAHWLIANGAVSKETFRFLRFTAKLKSKELAELLGTSPETITRWEKGQHPLPPAEWHIVASLALDRLRGSAETIERLRAARAQSGTDEPLETELDVGLTHRKAS